ncbi:MAG: AmmeMemoRadiSam system radical SAM enzyme [Candidatus Omnitrophota bacterium]
MLRESVLYSRSAKNIILCDVCSHHCRLSDGQSGVCGVRLNDNGILIVKNYAELVTYAVDPIEKKPLYHFLPGSKAYSIASYGCNFRCGFCQNFAIAQKYQNTDKRFIEEVLPEEIVSRVKKTGAESIAYTYTEPTVFLEYVIETAKLAKENGLKNVFISNGFFTDKAFELLVPYIDGYNIDLKSFNDDFYVKYCGGRLEPVLQTIKRIADSGKWLEVTTLIIPGKNDTLYELESVASYIAEVSLNIPWHITAFYPQNLFLSVPATPIEKMEKAFSIGVKKGLKYVYLGNVASVERTVCPVCKKSVIEREGYRISLCNVENGICVFCGAKIDGVFL